MRIHKYYGLLFFENVKRCAIYQDRQMVSSAPFVLAMFVLSWFCCMVAKMIALCFYVISIEIGEKGTVCVFVIEFKDIKFQCAPCLKFI